MGWNNNNNNIFISVWVLFNISFSLLNSIFKPWIVLAISFTYLVVFSWTPLRHLFQSSLISLNSFFLSSLNSELRQGQCKDCISWARLGVWRGQVRFWRNSVGKTLACAACLQPGLATWGLPWKVRFWGIHQAKPVFETRMSRARPGNVACCSYFFGFISSNFKSLSFLWL